MPDGLLELASASPWAYLLVLAAAALDAVFPVVPSETTLISAGDNGGYALGRVLGPRLERRVGEAGRRLHLGGGSAIPPIRGPRGGDRLPA